MAISSILPTTISLPTNPPAPISSLRVLSPSTTHLALSSSPSSPLLLLLRRGGGGGAGHGGAVAAPVRMGGGPRTFPGGVSKWQWKRMQAKKGKQLLKARLCRERQIYEMRKRAELRAAAAQLERPWEAPSPSPAPAPGAAETLFSVSADEQVKALADRFRRPGAFDAWNDRDGPQIFRKLPPTDDDDGNLPSARFFPKGAVHSVKPYGITNSKEEDTEVDLHKGGDDLGFGTGGRQRMRRRRRVRRSGEPPIDAEVTDPTRERTSSRLDSDDDALSRIDGRANTNGRRRSYLRPTADLSNLSIDEDSNRRSDQRWSRYSGSNDRINRGRIGDL